MKPFKTFHALANIVVIAGMLVMACIPTGSAHAAANLTITPITWNVVGLDSNNVFVGPNNFPVGVRVCNTGAVADTATNVTVQFSWDSSNSYVNLRPGSLGSDLLPVNIGSLAGGACQDVYFEVQVTRDAAARGTSRDYHITIDSDQTTPLDSPDNTEIYVEFLVSQSRNYSQNVYLGNFSNPIPPGGSMELVLGNTYTIIMEGSTATNGYEQIESFINFPNTIFQVLSVTTDYAVANTTHVSDPSDKLYGDACQWVNDDTSPSYRSCLDVGKAGGDITVTYVVKIIGGTGTSNPLSTLIYDFSGSSYHYNSDMGFSTRIANIISPATLTKSFSPNTVAANENSTLTYTIKSNSSSTLTDVNFADTTNWPSGMTVAATSVTTSGCGTPSPSSLVIGATSASFSNITLAPGGTCTIAIVVHSAVDGVYPDTTNDLFIGTLDTGSKASATLVVSTAPAPPTTCTTRTTMASWNFDNYTAATTANGGPFNASTLNSPSVTSAVGRYGAGTGSASYIVNPTTYPAGWGSNDAPSTTGNNGNSWAIQGGWPNTAPTPITSFTPYFQIEVDAHNYGGIAITSSYNMQGNWSNSGSWYVLYSTNGTTWSQVGTGAWSKVDAWQLNAITATTATSNNSTVYFRIVAAGAQNATAILLLDTVQVSGCPRPLPPTISKDFSPATIGSDASVPPATTANYTTLTYTIGNPNTVAMTGVAFTDTLPDGLVIANPPTVTRNICSDGLTTIGGTITAAAGTNTISLTGGALPYDGAAPTTCTFSVNVQGVNPGVYTGATANITNRILADGSGANLTGGADVGYGVADLTVLAAPEVTKVFSPNTLLTGQTGRLTFAISNPNPTTALSGVNFVGGDVLPAGLTVGSPSGLPNLSCTTGSLTGATITASGSTITLTGGTLSAGAVCSFWVNVTGTSTTGLQTNTVTVAAATAGRSRPSSADILVKSPTPSINISKSVGLGSDLNGLFTTSLTASIGTPLYYRFIVENTGDVDFSNVTVNDPTLATLLGLSNPFACSWFRLDPADTTPPYTYISTTTLPAASASTDPIAYCVVGPIPASASLATNTAYAHATYASGTQDSAPDTAFITLTAPDLSVTKTNNGPVAAGTPFTWTLTVSNTGTASANFNNLTDVILTDTVPSGPVYGTVTVTPVSGITGTVACSFTGLVLNCNPSGGTVSIAAGGSFTVSFPVTSPIAGSLVNPTGGTCRVDPAAAPGVVLESDETNNDCTNTASVTKLSPTISTITGAGGVVGVATLQDTASLTGGYSPTGTITFRLYPPTDPTCTGAATYTEAVTLPVTGTTTGFVPTSAGTWNWTAEYSGDGANNGTTSACGSEPVVVTKASPSATTSASPAVGSLGLLGTFGDTATITGGYGLNGQSVTFTLYSNDTCTTSVGSGSGTIGGGSATGSFSWTPTATGTYYWQATYAGDGNNDSFTTACGGLNEEVVVGKATPIISTTALTPIIVGGTITDTAHLSGGYGTLGGTVSFQVFAPGDTTCATPIAVNPAVTVNGVGDYTSAAYTPAVTGDYLWRAFYSGDGNNNPVSTACGDLNETSTVNPVLVASINVTKSSTTASITLAGQVVPYEFHVTNAGNMPLTGITVSDPNCDAGPTYVSGDTGGDGILGLLEDWTYTCSHTVTQTEVDAGGNLSNTVTADSTESDPDTDTKDIPVTWNPAMTLTKDATLDLDVVAPAGVADAGDTITYTFTVTNTGNQTLTNIVVTDPLLPTLNCTIASLAPGATDSCAATNNVYTLTQADIDAGMVTNTATVDGDCATGVNPCATTPVVKPTTITRLPGINVVKSSTTVSITAAGQLVPYTFTVTNTGNVSLTNITVSDPNCDASPVYQIGDTNANNKLDRTETWTYACSHTVTALEFAGGGTLDNTVTVNSTQIGPDTASLSLPIIVNPSLTIVKVVVNDNGGTGVVGDFSVNTNAGALVFDAGVTVGSITTYTATTLSIPAGAYTLRESDLSGYTEGTWSCTGGTLTNNTIALGSITLANGDTATCTITNNDDPASLTLVKQVVNDSGGTALVTDWTLTADGVTFISGVAQDVDAGTFNLAESGGPTGYTAGSWSCPGFTLAGNDITLANGDTAICTIINNDDPAHLTLVKQVTNDNGGTAATTDWTLTADTTTFITGVMQDVIAGTYTLAESGGPAGYTAGSWSCPGFILAGNDITLANGERATCTITNNDDPASLTLVKEVINDNGGTAAPTDWTLTADATTFVTGVAQDVNAGTYTLAESGGPAGYTPGSWSCPGFTLVGDDITLASGDTAVCTITNDDQKASPILNTIPGAGGAVGGITLQDTFTLLGGNFPTGTITFRLYPPTDPTCTGPAALTEVVTPVATGTFIGLVPTSVGTWNWTAEYSGDTNNNPATSPCGAEPVVVTEASPSATTTASPATGVVGTSATFGDTAVFSGGYGLNGQDVTFSLYSDNTCTTLVTGMSGTATISAGTASWSNTWLPTVDGTYYWQVDYAGDVNNNAFTTGCTDAGEQVVVSPIRPAINIAKTPAIQTVVSGANVIFTLTVTNTGDVALSNIVVADADCTTLTGPTGDDGDLVLQTTETWVYTCTMNNVTAGLRNTASAAGDPPVGLTVTDEDYAEVVVMGGITKTLVADSLMTTVNPQATIGEILTYEVTIPVPPGASMASATLIDTLDHGLAFLNCESITTTNGTATTDISGAPSTSFTPACNAPVNPTVNAYGSLDSSDEGRQIVFSFGTLANPDLEVQDNVVIRYRVVVLNIASVVGGVSDLNNQAAFSWPAGTLNAVGPNLTILEPELSLTKTPSGTIFLPGSVITYTLIVGYMGTGSPAYETVLTDVIPVGLTYVPGSFTFVSGQMPVLNDAAAPTITATWTAFQNTGTPTILTYQATLGSVPAGTSITNTANIAWTSLPGNVSAPQSPFNIHSTERFYDPASAVNVYGTGAAAAIGVGGGVGPGAVLPATGFAPGEVTLLPEQPAGSAYSSLGDLWLEIPRLNVKVSIVGVPLTDKGWDLTWLSNNAGYLDGTAYPTWNGNSAITAHVYMADGQPGPFVALNTLSWGDQVIVHAFGQRYIYEVRDNQRIKPTDMSIFRHEETPWLTLLTCQGYNEARNSYLYRIAVRATLVRVEADRITDSLRLK